jgi:hypothetical protein
VDVWGTECVGAWAGESERVKLEDGFFWLHIKRLVYLPRSKCTTNKCMSCTYIVSLPEDWALCKVVARNPITSLYALGRHSSMQQGGAKKLQKMSLWRGVEPRSPAIKVI